MYIENVKFIAGLAVIISLILTQAGFITSILEWLLVRVYFKQTQGLVVRSFVRKSSGRTSAYIYYTYEVNGKSYTQSRVDVGGEFGGRIAQKIHERYPEGKTVTVHYAPILPFWSHLEATLRAFFFELSAFIGTTLLIGLILSINPLRSLVIDLQTWLSSFF